jgi:hypothetical protein
MFTLVTYGKGGWTYDVVYNLPVYLRNYYLKQLADALEAEASARNEPPKTPRGRKK